jgi:hypothetical protein
MSHAGHHRFGKSRPRPYTILRETEWSLKGKRTTFVLMKDDIPILYSRIKSKSTTEIIHFSRQKNDFHFGNHTFEAALLVFSQFKTFVLRSGNQFGPELMKLAFSRLPVCGGPRFAQLLLFDTPDGSSRQFLSKEPVLAGDGKWVSALRGANGRMSVKNLVLLSQNNREFMSVSKVSSRALKIEADSELSDLCVFAFGIGSFLCSV